jgi:YD repeat-containing protein
LASRGHDTTAGYEYDAMNRLVRTLRDGQYVEQRLYDAGSRLVYQAAMVDTQLADGVDGGGFFAHLSKDAAKARIKALNEGVPQADQLPDNQRTFRYDANGRLLSERVNDPFGEPGYLVDYGGTDSYDAVGNILSYRVIQYGDNGYTNTFTNHLVRYEGYVIDRTDGTSTMYQDGSTTRQYDLYGSLTAITDAQGTDNNRRYYNDASGQALLVQQGDKIQRQLIANGQVLGRYGTGPDQVKPKDDDAHPQFTTGADLNFTYQVVNDRHPGTTPTGYSVQPGDTLHGIAKQTYGDAGYWYRIADANGLDAKAALHPGQQLQLPGLTGTTFNRADSMRPYDASKVIGDTTPTMPPPPPDEGGCGILGMIFVVIVAVVVAVYAPELIGPLVESAGIGGTAGTVVTGALTGAAASIVSQGVAIAIGVQDSFSWSQVGLAFIGGDVTAGIGEVATGAMAGQGTFAVVSRAMVANALTQGIGVATGLQVQFSWIGVAAAGVGAGVDQAVSEGLGITVNGVRTEAFAQAGWGERLAKSAFTGLAAGAATAVARGGRISVTQIAADGFGNAIGSSIAEASWGGTAQDTMTAREDFRRFEIEAINNDARIANALAMSGPGMSEMDYWKAPARTMADRYADTYGGQASRTGSFGNTEASSPTGLGWRDADGTAWLPETTIISRRGDGGLTGADNAYADWNTPGMPDNSPLRVVGQDANGGLIWNTGAVSYPVGSPGIEFRALGNVANSTTQPVYDLLTGLPTGYTTAADNAGTPAMSYGEQMHNVIGFAGTLGKNFSLGVAQGGIGLISDAAKGWAMIGDLALNGGSNISRLEQFNLRPFEYDSGIGQFGGTVGEMVSPGAYLRAAELGLVGLRTLGPTADAAIYNYLQRTGGVLGIVPESGVETEVPLGFKKVEDFEAFAGSLHFKFNGAGFSNVDAAFQGSSVTGQAFRPPHSPFDLGRVSDFDLAISSPDLFQKAQLVGIGLRQQGIRTGPLSLEKTPEFLERMGLTSVSKQLTLEAGRPVNFMIYRSIDNALLRSPSIIIPRYK